MMPEALKGSRFYVGLKQSIEAVSNNLALKAYIAEDVDNHLISPFKNLCFEKNIEIVYVESKKKLGKACGISVSAACAVILK